MNYMTLKQASEKWGISPRMINYYCSEERISGAENMKHPVPRTIFVLWSAGNGSALIRNVKDDQR